MRIRTENFVIPTAHIGGVNPLPAFRQRKPSIPKSGEGYPEQLRASAGFMNKVLPYLTMDRYNHTPTPKAIKSYVLENEYLEVRVLPEFGGRVHSLYDKKAERQLLFTNPVIQPGNLAIRNAWLSGGIEWNIGNHGHTYTTCDNVYAAILQDGEGNDFLRMWEFERNKSIFWQVDLHLPEDSRELICHVRTVNPFPKATTTYWWTNVAVPTDGGRTRVLASNKNVISFVDSVCMYETLPYIKAMPGIDVTYPTRAPRAFDYFIQKDEDGESTWEAAAYGDGLVFFERSTAPLYYKKLFTWGNHKGGNHWQEFLSDGIGTGYYAELQAGIAPSQLHDLIMPANSTIEWTQCFGGVKLDAAPLFDEDYNAAVEYCGEAINGRVSFEDITLLDEKMKRLAGIPVLEEDIIHFGSGFGAVEILRMEKDRDGKSPISMCFPMSAVGEAEKPWVKLIEEGRLPSADVTDIPLSYMTGEKWLPHITRSLKRKSWNAYLHAGVAIYEHQRLDRLINSDEVYNETDDRKQIDSAREAWQRSLQAAENVWALRNLAVLEEREENIVLAEEYYERAYARPEFFKDYALVSEYMLFLKKHRKFERLWEIFTSLPESFREVDRIKITAAFAAVKLLHFDYLERFFSEEHYDIREGEVSLTEIWFEYSAHKLARQRGIDNPTLEQLDALLEEAYTLCPPDYSIDFRMSENRKIKYRVG